MGKNESVKVLDHLMQKLPRLQRQEGMCCNAGGEKTTFSSYISDTGVLIQSSTKEGIYKLKL